MRKKKSVSVLWSRSINGDSRGKNRRKGMKLIAMLAPVVVASA